MKIIFDEKADAIYIYLIEPSKKRGIVKKTIEAQEGVLLDIDRRGRLLGIEILDVSARVPLKSLRQFSVDLVEKEAV
jgi:uncharacterized protein YuzE